MEHKGTKNLPSERLDLRPFTLDDAEAMYRNWASDKDVTRYLTWPSHADISVSREVLREWTAKYQDTSFYQWAIALKERPEEPVGSIGVVNTIDDRIQMAHIGYCIGKKWWHQGITSEALQRVIEYLFEEIGVHKVESRHDPRNPNSGLVMKKCGLRYEGTLRQSDWNNQGLCDASYYGLLANEWETLKNQTGRL